jgi:penicillin-binding protein 2
LGALGSINQEEYEEKKAQGKNYGFNDKIGKFGLEYSYEDRLKGEAGETIVQKNAQGSITDVVQTIDAQPGDTLYLTIDSELQKTANKALDKQIKAARANGKIQAAAYGEGHGEDCETGAVVMLRVKDFSVLAAASYPTYDLNKYSEYGDYYVKLATDKTSPMFNRAFVGSFAPGSVFKPCVACAALEEKLLTPDTLINCTKYYNYFSANPVACMGYHKKISLDTAVAKSCNYYFAEAGRLLGIDTMYLYAEKFGLGEKTGLEVNESKGILAGRDSKTWLEGNTVQAAIGQSDNAFTPVQLATYTATIANDGVRLKTHLIKEIRNYQRDKILYKYNTQHPEIMDTVGVSQENLRSVQQAMRAVVNTEGGTASAYFKDYPVKVAAKTGTAENSGSDHTVFICYAPFDDPEVALAVVLEHGASGKYSMTVAKEMLDAYFKK